MLSNPATNVATSYPHREAAQTKIERLSLSLRTAEGRHEEKAEALLKQLTALQSESDELSIENEALAAALLLGVKESAFCPASSPSSLPSSSPSLSSASAAWKYCAADSRDEDRSPDGDCSRWVPDRASGRHPPPLPPDGARGRVRIPPTAAAAATSSEHQYLQNLLPSEPRDRSYALDVLKELRKIGEEAALHLRSKCDLEKRSVHHSTFLSIAL